MNASYHILSQDPSDTRVRVYKKRKLHHKEDSGCISCKAKRVKCDEHHPICNRCQRTKRVCKYNVRSTIQRNSRANVPQSLYHTRTASTASHHTHHASLLYQPPQHLSLRFTFQPGPSSGTWPHHLLHHFLHTPFILAIPTKQPILDLSHSHPLVSHALLAFTASHLRHHAPSLQHRIAEHYQTSLTLTEYRRYLHTQVDKLGQEGLNAVMVAGTLLMMMAFMLPSTSTFTSTQPQPPGRTMHQQSVSTTMSLTPVSYSPSPSISDLSSTSDTGSKREPNWLSLQIGLRPLLLSLSKADAQSRSRSESDSNSSYLQDTLNFAATVFMGPELARLWTRRPIGLVNQNSGLRGRMDNASDRGDADETNDTADFVGDDGFGDNDKDKSERAEKTEGTEQSDTPIPHLWRRYFRLPEADIDVDCDGHADSQVDRHGGNNTMHRDVTATATGATSTHTNIPALDPTILALLPAVKLLARLRSLPHPHPHPHHEPQKHAHKHAHIYRRHNSQPPDHQPRPSPHQRETQSPRHFPHHNQTQPQPIYDLHPIPTRSPIPAPTPTPTPFPSTTPILTATATPTPTSPSSIPPPTPSITSTSTSIFTHLAFLPKLAAVQHLLHPTMDTGPEGSDEGENEYGREKAIWCLGYWWGLMGRFVGIDVGVDVGVDVDVGVSLNGRDSHERGHRHRHGQEDKSEHGSMCARARARVGVDLGVHEHKNDNGARGGSETDGDADGLWWCRDRIRREYWGILGWCRDRERGRERERRGGKVRRRGNRGGHGECDGEDNGDGDHNSETDGVSEGVNDGDARVWSAMVRELEMAPYIGLSDLN